MRIRLPPQLKIAKSYGRLMQDPLYEDVYHVLLCDLYETFCLDMEHVADLASVVTLQIAFQYKVPVFISDKDKLPQFELQKRLRIATMQLTTTHLPREIYEQLRSEVVVNFLMHKVMVAVKAEGLLKAAVLLQDWLIILAASFAKNPPTAGPFVACEGFQPLIRLVYGLLRSPVLLGSYVNPLDDKQIFLEHVWSSLPSDELQRAIYPNLMSFWSPQDRVCVTLWESLIESLS